MKWLLNVLRKLLKRKLFWFLLILVIGGIFAFFYLTKPKPIIYVTEKAQKGTVTQIVSETGSIKPASEINLNFKGNGTITEINVEEGDEVKKGDILAGLDAGTVSISVRQAQANLDMAQANMNILLAGSKAEDLNVSEKTVNNAKIAYDNALRDHQALLSKLDSDINLYDQTVSDSRQNLLLTLDTVIIAADHSIDVMDVIFDDSTLKPLFSVKNFQYKIDAQMYFDQSGPKITLAKQAIAQVKADSSDPNIYNAIDKSLDALNTVKKALDNTFFGLTSSITSADFNDNALENYKTRIKSEQASIDGSISSLNTINNAYQTAKINLQTATSNKDLQIANSQSAVDSALGAYNLAQAQYDLKKAKPRPVDVSYYQAQVDQARAALDLALKNYSDYTITAPMDGKIVFVNNEVGEQIGFGVTNIAESAKPVITMLGTGQFEIDVDVPESDIIKVKIGNKVKITLDAYGDAMAFTGNVIFIDLAETNIQGVIYYKVKVELDPTDQEIKPGMTANVDIITAQKENVIYVPSRAVKENVDGQKYVEILQNGSPQKLNVTAGLKGDEGIEISSGLNEGQEVIIYSQ